MMVDILGRYRVEIGTGDLFHGFFNMCVRDGQLFSIDGAIFNAIASSETANREAVVVMRSISAKSF